MVISLAAVMCEGEAFGGYDVTLFFGIFLSQNHSENQTNNGKSAFSVSMSII